MKKNSLRPHLDGASGRSRRPACARWLGALLAGCLGLTGACGELRPVPEGFEAQTYKPIEYQALLDPTQAGLQAGELVRVKGFFWQYLYYDPAMVRNYLTLPRYPVQWYKLRWFAIYGSEQMTGYYDLAALSPDQAKGVRKDQERLDPILIYGEVSKLSSRVLPPGASISRRLRSHDFLYDLSLIQDSGRENPPAGAGIGLFSAMAIGIGGMVGAGIFSILGVVAQAAGNALWLSFLVGGVVALLSTYSYVKLGVRYPSAAGAVEFLVQGFGDGVWSGGINLYMWIGYIIALALYAQGFVGYALTFFPSPPPAWLPKGIGVGIILVFTGVNFIGARTWGAPRPSSSWSSSPSWCSSRASGCSSSGPLIFPLTCWPPVPASSLAPECYLSATKASDW